jgi:serine/threonine-protein kinase RsbW
MSVACATQFRLARRLNSRLEEVDETCRALRQALQCNGMESCGFALETVARECLNNAVLHGNGSDAQRLVEVELRCARKWIWLRISDEGVGFHWRKLRGRPLPAADATGGRGLRLVAAYADRLRFNQQGNAVTLGVRRPQTKRKYGGV